MSMDMQEYQALLQQLKDKYAKEVIVKSYAKDTTKKVRPAKLKPKTFKPK